MILVYAFLVGGLICMLAQVILDLFELTPGVITAIFVSLGSVLEIFNLYDNLIILESSLKNVENAQKVQSSRKNTGSQPGEF